MENASKALIMAGSVLIALLIIGALLLMFNNLTSYQETDTQTTREAQIIEFNNQYETYNRNNVRGSDLYSLFSRVIDYNRRKSTQGTGSKDEGQFLAYQPMTIKVSINENRLQDFYATADSNFKTHIIKTSYEQSDTKHVFEKEIYEPIRNIERGFNGNKEVWQKLSEAKDKIFIDKASLPEEKLEAIFNYSSITGEENSLNSDSTNSQIESKWRKINEEKEKVYQYYEYVQFKRAKFDCKHVGYDEQTGRIIEMRFEFTGKFE